MSLFLVNREKIDPTQKYVLLLEFMEWRSLTQFPVVMSNNNNL